MGRGKAKEKKVRKPRRSEEAPRRRSRHLEEVKRINPNDHELMKEFVTEHGKIVPARLLGASARQQRQIKRGVRRARVMGILP